MVLVGSFGRVVVVRSTGRVDVVVVTTPTPGLEVLAVVCCGALVVVVLDTRRAVPSSMTAWLFYGIVTPSTLAEPSGPVITSVPFGRSNPSVAATIEPSGSTTDVSVAELSCVVPSPQRVAAAYAKPATSTAVAAPAAVNRCRAGTDGPRRASIVPCRSRSRCSPLERLAECRSGPVQHHCEVRRRQIACGGGIGRIEVGRVAQHEHPLVPRAERVASTPKPVVLRPLVRTGVFPDHEPGQGELRPVARCAGRGTVMVDQLVGGDAEEPSAEPAAFPLERLKTTQGSLEGDRSDVVRHVA